MNPLLLAGGLAVARRSAGEAVHRAVLGIAAYAVLALCGLVTVGFLTAAGLIHLAETRGAVVACAIIAGIYAVIGGFGFLLLLLLRNRRRRLASRSPVMAALEDTTSAAGDGLPGGIVSLGLVAAAGYLVARSMIRKR